MNSGFGAMFVAFEIFKKNIVFVVKTGSSEKGVLTNFWRGGAIFGVGGVTPEIDMHGFGVIFMFES